MNNNKMGNNIYPSTPLSPKYRAPYPPFNRTKLYKSRPRVICYCHGNIKCNPDMKICPNHPLKYYSIR
jgi:hypothetical protein